MEDEKFEIKRKWSTHQGGMILSIPGQLLFYREPRDFQTGEKYTLAELEGFYEQTIY